MKECNETGYLSVHHMMTDLWECKYSTRQIHLTLDGCHKIGSPCLLVLRKIFGLPGVN